jgi:SET and MYND domain-containing protein
VEEGEEICIAYAEVYATRETRREALWEKKAFACECRRCADAASARRDAPLGGWRCPRLSACDGVVPDAGDSCLTCGAKCARARSKRDAAERRWIGRHAAALTALRENDHATAVSIACEVVRESDDALCDAHVIRHECRLVLMDAHAALKQWRHAADVSRDVADAMRRFVNVNHPGRAHALRCLGDALVALVDVDERKERRKTVVAKGGGKKKGAAHAHAHAAAVDVSSSAAVALAEAAAAYRRAGAILEIAYGRHHPATTEARDSELAARARMQSLH